MLNLGTDEMAKYPFLTEAGQYLKDKGFSLDQFGTDPDLKPILDKAYNRIEIATTGKIYRSEVTSLEDLDLEVFSFLLAVILLKLSGMNTLIRRFSLAEARRQVEHGKVILSSHETVRLIRKELDNYIASKIRSTGTPSMLEALKKPVERLVSLGKKFSVPTVVSTEYPPCIKHAIEVLDKGENLPHSGRFLLATYLLGNGQNIEQIAPLFKNAPDYNEKITMYQLNHLKGSSGSGTEYKCPSCERVKSKDLCFATSDCDGIINPLQFKKKKILNA